MPVMKDIRNKIRETLGEYRPEVARICLELLEYVTSQPLDKNLHLTYSLLKSEGGAKSDSELLLALQYLSGDSARVLDMKFEFLDESGEYISVEDEIVAEARQSDIFYHPFTGQPVPDYQKSLVVYFARGTAVQTVEA